MATVSIDDLICRIETQSADKLQAQLGIVSYQAIAMSDGTIVTVTVFDSEASSIAAPAAAEGVRDTLANFRVKQINSATGPVRRAIKWNRQRALSAALLRAVDQLEQHGERDPTIGPPHDQ